MGCLVPRPDEAGAPGSQTSIKTLQMSPEQKIIMQHEKKLPFSNLSSRQVIRTIKAQTMQDSLSRPQLKRAFHDLQIPGEVLSNPDNPFFKVIKRLKNEKKLYDLKLLSILAILLGQGGVEEKASWLFRQYDTDAQGMLDAAEIGNMVNDLAKISIDVLPHIAKGEQTGYLSQVQFSSYMERLVNNKNTLVEKATKDLLVENDISEHQFTQKMMKTESDIAHLLWAFGVRTLVHNQVQS